jgi:hypothetical protein
METKTGYIKTDYSKIKDNELVCDDLLIGLHKIIYIEIYHDIVKLDADGIFRTYQQCEYIDEGILG